MHNVETKKDSTSEDETETYQLNIWNVETSSQKPPKFSSTLKDDFKRELSINNNITRILIDTGAKVSVVV